MADDANHAHLRRPGANRQSFALNRREPLPRSARNRSEAHALFPLGRGFNAALHRGAFRGLRGARARSGRHWHLRRALIFCDAAHARNWNSRGARRAALKCFATGAARRRENVRTRHRHRPRCRIRAHAPDAKPSLRRGNQRPANIFRSNSRNCRRNAAKRLRPARRAMRVDPIVALRYG